MQVYQHPTDGNFTVSDYEPPCSIWPAGRVKRTEGRWYPLHVLRAVTLPDIGDKTPRGIVTAIDISRAMVALNGGKIIWPVNLLSTGVKRR